MKLKPMAALMAAVVLLVVAGCGGDDEGNGAATTNTTETAAGAETLDVSLVDFEIEPANPTIDQPGEVELRITNDGQAPHNLEVEGPEGEQVLPEDLAAGESGTLRVNLSRAGTYEWYCPVGNHREQGMEGEVRVSGGGGQTTTGDTTTGETTTEDSTTGETTTGETTTGDTTTQEDSGGGSGSNSGSGGSGGGY